MEDVVNSLQVIQTALQANAQAIQANAQAVQALNMRMEAGGPGFSYKAAKALKPDVKLFVESDMGAFFMRYRNWLQPQQLSERERKHLLFCEVCNGQTSRNVDALIFSSNDDAISYDQFETELMTLFCPPNASLISQRAFKNYRQSGTEPPLTYAAEKVARWEKAYPVNGPGRNEKELIIQLASGLYHSGLKAAMIRDIHNLTKVNFSLRLGDQLSICHQLYEEGLTEDTSLLGLYVTHGQVPYLETNTAGPVPMELNRLGDQPSGPRKCHHCGSPSHLLRACPTYKPGSRERTATRGRTQPAGRAGHRQIFCQRCHGNNHSKADCYIPQEKLALRIQQNDRRNPGAGNRRTGVNLIQTEGDLEEECDPEDMLVGMLSKAHISTMGFRQGSKM